MKAFCDNSGAGTTSGRLFQVVGLLVAKLRCAASIRTRGPSTAGEGLICGGQRQGGKMSDPRSTAVMSTAQKAFGVAAGSL